MQPDICIRERKYAATCVSDSENALSGAGDLPGKVLMAIGSGIRKA